MTANPSDLPPAAMPTARLAPGDAPRVSEPLTVGSIIDRYTVLEPLGAGAMGQVYAAYDGKLDRKVALKLLQHRSGEYEARLMREAQAMARLSHANVVAVFDAGLVSGRMYLAMEFVQGGTLRQWQRSRAHDWREVVRVYAEAGRGLAAAHAAGLVHRDFKPDNVLIADDGVVKVTDFGIACAVAEQSTLPKDEGAKLGEPTLVAPLSERPQASMHDTGSQRRASLLAAEMTETGTLLGTPAYMAPEQFLFETVDERTDQFAFCVALHEALYGTKPFGDSSDRSLSEVAKAVLEGKVVETPKGVRVPSRLRRVLLRGLSESPNARYPSMRALLEDLGRDPTRKRRQIVAGLGAGLAFSVCATVAVRAATAHQARLCSATEREAAEVWNPQVAERVERSLLATGVPYAADTWKRTREQIDDYMHRWAAMHKEACEATRIHGHQSESVMTLRMTCLDQRRSEVRSLAEVLQSADARVAAKALQASMSLTSVDVCKDVASLTALAPEPTDAAKRAELKSVREGFASTEENISTGRYQVALEQASLLVARSRALGYAPALAEALLLKARADNRLGRPRSEVIDDAVEAVQAADEGNADPARADAMTKLTDALSQDGQYDEAERWARAAEGALHRLRESGALSSTLHYAVGLMKHERGLGGVEDLREAVRLGRAAGLPPVNLAGVEGSLAELEAGAGHYDTAEALVRDADELLVRTMGANHPTRIGILLAKGNIGNDRGDERAAFEGYRAAYELGERVAPEHPDVAIAYSNTCSVLSTLGKPADALPLCEKALAYALKDGPDGDTVAYSRTHSGKALQMLNRLPEAFAQFDAAAAIHRRTGNLSSDNYGAALLGAGETKLRMGDAKAAKDSLERAVAVLRSSSDLATADIQGTLAEACFELAKARWETGEQSAPVVELAENAASTYGRLGKDAQASEVEAWMRTHSRRR